MAGTWWQQLRIRLLPTARPRRCLHKAPSAPHAEVLLARTLPSAIKIGPIVAQVAGDGNGLGNSRIGEALSNLLNSLDGGSDDGEGEGDHGTIGEKLNSILESLNVPEDFDFKSWKQTNREIRRANREARREHRHDSDSGGDSELTSQQQTTLRRPNRISPKRLF